VSFDEVLQRANVLALLTDHGPFRTVSPEQLAGKIIVDPRGVWRQATDSAVIRRLPAAEDKRRVA
jgi:UDP-N-acetyl-D-mannosaminuronate dehydrogenase